MTLDEQVTRRLAWILLNEKWRGRYRSETPDTLWEDLLDDDERDEFRKLWASSANAGGSDERKPDAAVRSVVDGGA